MELIWIELKLIFKRFNFSLFTTNRKRFCTRAVEAYALKEKLPPKKYFYRTANIESKSEH